MSMCAGAPQLHLRIVKQAWYLRTDPLLAFLSTINQSLLYWNDDFNNVAIDWLFRKFPRYCYVLHKSEAYLTPRFDIEYVYKNIVYKDVLIVYFEYLFRLFSIKVSSVDTVNRYQPNLFLVRHLFPWEIFG